MNIIKIRIHRRWYCPKTCEQRGNQGKGNKIKNNLFVPHFLMAEMWLADMRINMILKEFIFSEESREKLEPGQQNKKVMAFVIYIL